MKIEKLLELYDGIVSESHDELDKMGISPEPPRPELFTSLNGILSLSPSGDPFFGDLTAASDTQIGALFSYYNGWTAMVQSKVTKMESELKIAKKKQKVIETALSKFLKDNGTATSNLKQEMMLYTPKGSEIPLWVQIDVKIAKLETKFLAADTRYKNLRSSINTISREQSRRESEMRHGSRSNSIQSKKLPTGNSRWR